MMKAVAVIDKNLGIGKGGKLLYCIPSDLKHFRDETLGKTVIMGRKTLESLPGGRPLPGRNTVVLSQSLAPGVFFAEHGWLAAVVPSKEDALELFESGALKDPVVCGGERIYELFLPECGELVLTEVDGEREADAFFPEFSGEFEEYEAGPEIDENGLKYKIKKYRRIRKK